jgi:hypothetical protein
METLGSFGALVHGITIQKTAVFGDFSGNGL